MNTPREVLEFVLGYLWFLPQYPFGIYQYAGSQPIEVAVWLVVSFAGVIAFGRSFRGRALKPFVAIWIMPALLVCGAAGMWPWPYSLPAIFERGRCATPASSAICLGLNFAVVYGVAAAWSRLPFRRKANP